MPQGVLLGRKIVIEAISVPGAYVETDAWAQFISGKPRLRREHSHDRSTLNVFPLIAALALLPDPMREDKRGLVLPLREKGYVISAISFLARHADNQRVICIPQRMRVLHDKNEIDLVDRLTRISSFLSRSDLPTPIKTVAERYQHIIRQGVSTSNLRRVSNELISWLQNHAEIADSIEAPSEHFTTEAAEPENVSFDLTTLTADETKRRLVAHYKIDRSRKIRKAKVSLFENTQGRIFCENCEFNFERKYGERGKGFIEVHHVLPLAAILPNSITNLRDLMLLCANCHRIVHRKQPILAADELRGITQF